MTDKEFLDAFCSKDETVNLGFDGGRWKGTYTIPKTYYITDVEYVPAPTRLNFNIEATRVAWFG